MTGLEEALRRAESDAKSRGYFLNPDQSFLRDLLEGLVENERRYGYPSCPCRVATGNFDLDRDIICPCDYRDPDVEEFGACYCALYVRRDVFEGKSPLSPVPERRPRSKQVAAASALGGSMGMRGQGSKSGSTVGSGVEHGSKVDASNLGKTKEEVASSAGGATGMKLWYCKQCGYVAYRDEPPYVCPVCKAKREMFAELRLGLVG